ncbi:hypothetical protein [Methylomonas rapida]|uniref:Uncharacterized protein n=1 Tax=Methylomonas rapida TaxID=2963939 RepID=A0ABY7GDJ6_9GAMM|nr:hypothetical protein [Methylomonas rapida]WAR43372.1 hypothetical protein NM686_013345 [Methylomonas rapida]
MKGVNRLFVVSYEIDYVHRVSIGITADSPETAQQIAEQAFNDATLWDDTAAMPLSLAFWTICARIAGRPTMWRASFNCPMSWP